MLRPYKRLYPGVHYVHPFHWTIYMYRRTKILTTLGPASDTPKVLAEMIRAGVDAVRVNFSHGDPEDHAKRVQRVRDAASAVGKWVGVLADLQGPKIRIDSFID